MGPSREAGHLTRAGGSGPDEWPSSQPLTPFPAALEAEAPWGVTWLFGHCPALTGRPGLSSTCVEEEPSHPTTRLAPGALRGPEDGGRPAATQKVLGRGGEEPGLGRRARGWRGEERDGVGARREGPGGPPGAWGQLWWGLDTGPAHTWDTGLVPGRLSPLQPAGGAWGPLLPPGLGFLHAACGSPLPGIVAARRKSLEASQEASEAWGVPAPPDPTSWPPRPPSSTAAVFCQENRPRRVSGRGLRTLGPSHASSLLPARLGQAPLTSTAGHGGSPGSSFGVGCSCEGMAPLGSPPAQALEDPSPDVTSAMVGRRG